MEDGLCRMLHGGDDPRIAGEVDHGGLESPHEGATADETEAHRRHVLRDGCTQLKQSTYIYINMERLWNDLPDSLRLIDSLECLSPI